jgi:hypothetical protein
MIAHWASLVPERELSFPGCLELEAQARYVEKK